MAVALIAAGGFDVQVDLVNVPTYVYTARVIFALASGFNISIITVPVVASDTLATLNTKLLSALDAEAQAKGISAPTAVYGGAVTKMR